MRSPYISFLCISIVCATVVSAGRVGDTLSGNAYDDRAASVIDGNVRFEPCRTDEQGHSELLPEGSPV